MRRFFLVYGGLSVVFFVVAALVPTAPKHKVTSLNPRYGMPAIGPTAIKDAQDFTVLLSDERMGGIGRGTGVLIDSTTVLTCAHMLPEDHSAKNMWIYPYPGAQVVHAKVRFVNEPNDLALLTLDTPVTGHKVPVFASKTEVGEPIVVVGNINGYMMWFVSYGILSGEHDRWILTDALIHGGNSGGPWINAKGEIVALTDVGWQDESRHDIGISGGVPVQALVKFLAEAKLKKPDAIYALTGE